MDNRVSFIQATSNTTTTAASAACRCAAAEAEADMITNVRRYVGRIKSKRQHSSSLADSRPTTFDYYVMPSFGRRSHGILYDWL